MSIQISTEEINRRLRHIENWQSQGISMMAYSRSAGLNYNNFKQWCYKWKQSGGNSAEKPVPSLSEKTTPNTFIPIEIDRSKMPVSRPASSSASMRLARFEMKLLFGLIEIRIG